MDDELQMARKTQEGWAELLARVGYRVSTAESNSRDKRAQISSVTRGRKASQIKDTTPKGKSSGKAKGPDGVPTKQQRRRRDNKNRQQDRGDEGKDTTPRRTAKQLGIVFSTNCTSSSHYWKGKEMVHKGVMFQCKNCLKYIWLPASMSGGEHLSKLMEQYGKDEGYCRFLDKDSYRDAKILIAKMQELSRLSDETYDKVEFAKLINKILSKKEYDYI